MRVRKTWKTFSITAGDNPQQRVVDRLIGAYERYRPVNLELVHYFEVEFLVSVLVDMTDRLSPSEGSTRMLLEIRCWTIPVRLNYFKPGWGLF